MKQIEDGNVTIDSDLKSKGGGSNYNDKNYVLQ
jgi:hypothetical protein